MLVPLYEAMYERLEVGSSTRLLGLGCGSGLALLMAASRGATVTGLEAGAPERLALARERLLPAARGTRARAGTRLVDGEPADLASDAVTRGRPRTTWWRRSSRSGVRPGTPKGWVSC